MTIREAIHRVKRLFREINSDSRLSDRTVYSLLSNHSKWLIYRESEKFKLLKLDKLFQPLNCIDVIEAPLIDPCCGIRNQCTIFRTKDKLPDMFEDSYGGIIRSVTAIDNQTSLTLIKPSEWERKQKNPWINKDKKNSFYFYSDGHLYFPNGSWKKVNISAIFKDDISEIDNCNKCSDLLPKCKRYLDKSFIIPEYLESQMFDLVLKDLSNTYTRIPEKSASPNKNDTK